jgi:hypothetical protein
MPTASPDRPTGSEPEYRWWQNGYDEVAAQIRRWEMIRARGKSYVFRRTMLFSGGIQTLAMTYFWFFDVLPFFYTSDGAHTPGALRWLLVVWVLGWVAMVGFVVLCGRLCGEIMWRFGEWQYHRMLGAKRHGSRR